MKRIIAMIVGIVLCTPSYAANLVATVNDTPVSKLDVANAAKLLKFQQAEKYETASNAVLQKDALENVIETILKKQKATSLDISLPEKEIDNAISHLEQQNQMPSGTLVQVLQKKGIPVKTLRNQVEADLLWLNYLRSQSQYVAIPDTSVKKRMQLMKDDLAKQGITGNSILLWELAQGLLPEDVNPQPTLESKTCDAFLDHIAIGPYPESAQAGWVDPHTLPSELYALLDEVAVGNTLGPLKTPQGMLLFMKCDVRSQRVLPSMAELKDQMEMEQMEMLSRRLLEMERRRATIEYK